MIEKYVFSSAEFCISLKKIMVLIFQVDYNLILITLVCWFEIFMVFGLIKLFFYLRYLFTEYFCTHFTMFSKLFKSPGLIVGGLSWVSVDRSLIVRLVNILVWEALNFYFLTFVCINLWKIILWSQIMVARLYVKQLYISVFYIAWRFLLYYILVCKD